MKDRIDEGRLKDLMEDSQDLQSDAMTSARANLNDYVEAAKEAQFERERSGWTPAVAVAGAVGAATLLGATPAFAQGNADISALQTAAALENLAVATYTAAAGLPFISDGNPVILTFAGTTLKQHAEHASAFNAAAVKLGGREQTGVPAKYDKVVKDALPGLKGPADVVALALTLEDIAAQTYVKNVSQASTAELRQLFSSVAGVEAQHVSILLAVKALVATPQLITLPPDLTKLPGAAGTVGFPNAFYPTDMAAGVEEGAVK